MLSLYQTLSVRYLRRRWLRALLIVASIALGVTTLVATQALNQTMTRAGLSSLNPLAGTADLLVSNGESPVARSLAGELEKVEGVKAAMPRIFENAKLVDLPDTSVLLVGVDRNAEEKAEAVQKAAGQEPAGRKLWDVSIPPDLQELAELHHLWTDPQKGWLERLAALQKLAADTQKLWPAFRKLRAVLPETVSLERLQEVFVKKGLAGLGTVLGKELEALNVAAVGKELAARLPEDATVLKVLVPGQATPPVLGADVVGLLDPPRGQGPFMATFVLLHGRAGQNQPARVVRIGTVEGHGPLAALSGNVLVFRDLETAARLAGLKEGQVSRIDLILEPGAEREAVKAAVNVALAGRAAAHTPEEKNEIIANAMSGMQVGFSLCGLAALVVGMFLVYNALKFSVAERRHEIGILLSVGATRQQVQTLFAGEAAVLGLAGSLLGIPLGIGLARALQPLVQAVLENIFQTVKAQRIEASPAMLLMAVLAGLTTAVAACLLPAVAASKENPAEAVRQVPRLHTWRFHVSQAAASLLLIAVGVGLILLRAYLPHRASRYGGLILVLVGALVATPLLADAAARLLQAPVRLLFGIEARLAADNLVRSPQRTGLVIAALAAGVALVMQTAGTIRSNREALRDWVQQSIGADLLVSSGSPVGSGAQGRPMPEYLGRQLEQMTEVERALPMRSLRHDYGDTRILLMTFDGRAYYDVNLPRHTADLELYKALGEGKDLAIVSENFAALHHVRRGDTITLHSPQGPVHLQVIGQVVDYSWNHGSVFVNREDYLRHWQDHRVDVFDVYLKPGADKEAVKESILRHFGAENGLVVQTREELQEFIDGAIEQLYSIAYVQQVVVMLVAALGVVTAFLISVLQRRREMGLLRAIGASQAQVVRSVLAEAGLMGLIGTAIGLLVGVPLEWFVLRVAMLEESGYLFAVRIPWVESLVIAAAALVLATLAGLGPALYAVRQRIPEAIAYE
jgi:putative ABC transport system permease protein